MALECMIWVLKHSRSKHDARLVLLAISDNANSDGTEAWPSVAEIAHKANCGLTSTRDNIQKLVELGELHVDWNKGPGGVNRYTVIMRDYPPRSTERSQRRRGPTPPDSGAHRNPASPEIRCTEDSSPHRNPADPHRISGETPPDSVKTPPESGDGTVLNPPRNRPVNRPVGAADAAAAAERVGLWEDETPPAVEPGPSEGAYRKGDRVYPRTAQGLVALWIDNCSPPPLDQVRGHVASQVGKLVQEGIPWDDIRRGLGQWHVKRANASAIPSFVHQVRQAPVAGAGRPVGAAMPRALTSAEAMMG